VSETGAVKFSCEHIRKPLAHFAAVDELNICRRELLARGWIGADANGIGFGNLSVRDGSSDCFYITGSGTSTKRELTLSDYARVTACDFAKNWLRCEGDMIASAESLTHAAVYKSDPCVRAVIHVHDLALWNATRDVLPGTSADAEYGTPAIAGEVRRLFRDTNVAVTQLFRMGGHEGGLVAFGENLYSALRVLVVKPGAGSDSRIR
jgi:L-ribulose-5-phosphate 4-epimerase